MDKKISACGHTLSPDGFLVLDDCIGYPDCFLESVINTGDHTLLIGKIIAGAMKNAVKNVTLSANGYDGVYRGGK